MAEVLLGMILASLLSRPRMLAFNWNVGATPIVSGVVGIYCGSNYYEELPRALIYGAPSTLIVGGPLRHPPKVLKSVRKPKLVDAIRGEWDP
jgi:hypothetical protein